MSSLPTEREVIQALQDGERDPFEDADEIQREKYCVTCIHESSEGEIGLEFKYTGGWTDHGGALEPHEATILTPAFGDNAATFVH